MTPEVLETFRCGAAEGYMTVPFLSEWGFSWPFMHLDLRGDSFVLRPVWFLHWLKKSVQIRYEAVADASVRSEFPPHIRMHLADPSTGRLDITTPNEGALTLAARLEAIGVPVRELS